MEGGAQVSTFSVSWLLAIKFELTFADCEEKERKCKTISLLFTNSRPPLLASFFHNFTPVYLNSMFEHKAFEQKDCIAYVDLKDPKFLVVKGPKIKKAVKFDLMFLFRVHQVFFFFFLCWLWKQKERSTKNSLSVNGYFIVCCFMSTIP